MQRTVNSKKVMQSLVLAMSMGMIFAYSASARQGFGNNAPCQMQMTQLDPVAQKAREAFFSETVELRKQMAQKRAEMRVMMNAQTADTAQASLLAGELFDLREQLRTIAQEKGLPPQIGMGGRGNFNHGAGGKGRGFGGQKPAAEL